MKSAVADLGTEVPLCDFVAMQRSCKSNLALVWLKLEQWAELRQVPAERPVGSTLCGATTSAGLFTDSPMRRTGLCNVITSA